MHTTNSLAFVNKYILPILSLYASISLNHRPFCLYRSHLPLVSSSLSRIPLPSYVVHVYFPSFYSLCIYVTHSFIDCKSTYSSASLNLSSISPSRYSFFRQSVVLISVSYNDTTIVRISFPFSLYPFYNATDL